MKRITKWWAKYFTHPSSYYPVPQTGMSFQDVQFMTPLPPEALSKKEEETMKEWLENYRPVEEYESDSDDSDNEVDIESEELLIGKPIMTRSGRQVKVWTRFDV
ncbi:hypothetical protein ACROYT_G036858 [Oculina patagonica]